MRNDQRGPIRRLLAWMVWLSQLLGAVALAQDTTPPTVPTGFTAVAASSTAVVLNWIASSDNVAVTGYVMERCQGSGCTSSFTTFNLSGAGWTNTSVAASTTYGYRVRAKDAVPNYSAFTSIVYVTTPAPPDTQAPTMPTAFTAVAASSTVVVLNWIASSDNVAVTGYELERCQGSGCTSSFTAFNLSGDGWTNTSLAASTTYGYRVRAKDAVPNYSAFTSIVYVTTPAPPDTQAPTTPTGLTATAASSTAVVLNWTASSDNVAVSGYDIERCQGSSCSSSFTAFSNSSVGWTDTGVAPSTTYGYRVRAKDAAPNYSAFTSIVYATTPAAGGDTQPPSVPTNPTATAASSTGIVVKWNASTDNVGVASYEVQLCQGSGCNSNFTVYGSSAVTRAIVSLAPSTTYGYRVRAKDAVPNYSVYTAMVYVTTLAAPDTQSPTVPTSFTATAASSVAVTLNWSAASDNIAVTGYELERCQGSGCTASFTQLSSIGVGFTDTGLSGSTTYGYRLRAKDAVPNYSPFTSIVYVTTQAGGGDTQAPSVPTNPTATAASSTGIVVRWNASTDNVGVASYEIELCQGSSCNSNFTMYGSSAVTRSIINLAPSTTYGYRVRAKDAVPNFSAYTAIVYVTTLAGAADTQAPSVPTNVTAVAASSTSVVVNWNPASDNVDVAGYDVDSCQGSGCNSNFTTYGSSGAGRAIVGLTASTTYGFRIRAKDAVPNYSAYTGIVYVTTLSGGADTQAPTVPTNLGVTASSSTSVVVTWSASSDNIGVTGYQIERCQGTGCNASFTPFSFASTSPGWANIGLAPSTTYGYRVRALDAAPNFSAFTSITYVTTPATGSDTQAPTLPGGLSATASSGTQVVLSWTTSTDNLAVTGYQLERCQGSGCNAAFSRFETPSTGYTDTGRTAGTTYGYRVRAKDAVPNYSAFTAILYVTTPAASTDTQAPTVPSNFSVSSSLSAQTNLAWAAASDNVAVTGYQVERCIGSGCSTGFTSFTVAVTAYTDIGRSPSTTYGYRVRSTDAAGNFSAFSSIAYATTPATVNTQIRYRYDDGGRLRDVTFPNSTQTNYELDAAGNRKNVQTTFGAGLLQFTVSTASIAEAASTFTATVTRTGTTNGATSIAYAAVNGGSGAVAHVGADFTATTGILNWANGDGSPRSISVPITNDTANEPPETFTIRLASPAGGALLGANHELIVTIVDDDLPPLSGTAQFTVSSATVNEQAGVLNLTVQRTGTQGFFPAASVLCSTSSGSAVANTDFSSVSTTLSWPAGDASNRTCAIPLIDDTAVEGTKYFSVALSNFSGVTQGSPNSLIVTLLSEDVTPAAGLVQLAGEWYDVTEGAAPTLSIPIVRIGTAGHFGPAQVDCMTSFYTGGAAPGADFSPASQTVTWAAGDSSTKYCVFNIVDDAEHEGEKSFSVQLTNLVGVDLDANHWSVGVRLHPDGDTPPPNVPGQPTWSAEWSACVAAGGCEYYQDALLRWGAVSGATRYEVSRVNWSNPPVTIYSGPATSLMQTNAERFINDEYRVRACNASGCGPWSLPLGLYQLICC